LCNVLPVNTFIEDIPKCELHLHLEGSLRLPTVQMLAERHGIDVGDRPHLERVYQFDGFPEFAKLFMTGLDVMRTGEDLVDVIDALTDELAAQNVRYAEVTTTAYAHIRRGMPSEDYARALDEGRRRAAAARNVELSWIIDIPRDVEPAEDLTTARFITGPHAPENVVAIGLGGSEINNPAQQFAASFALAKSSGLRSVPHAGETDGPHSVRAALDALHADRIGHGIRAIEDDDLVKRLANEHTPLEIAITSNVLLGAVRSRDAHPVKELVARGVTVTINTDDPAYFSTTLVDELRIARELLQLDDEGIRQLQLTAVDASFAPDELKRRLRDELVRWPAPPGT
jgi:adenosine deaminase